MSTGLPNELMERVNELAEDKKLKLADFLAGKTNSSENIKQTANTKVPEITNDSDAIRRQQHLAWLNANREKYAGQYVALDGSKLVGTGNTIREAEEAARQRSVKKPFVVYLFPTDSLPFGGW